MYLDKAQSETNLELGLYLEAHLDSENNVMNTHVNKTHYKENLDLSLYIEALFNLDEVETELAVEIETKELNDVVVSETAQEKVEESPIPLWAQKPFECLLVKSAGMNLMLPAMSVSYIELINKKIIRLPLDVEAFRGVLTLRQRSVAVIDLVALISENASAAIKSSTQVESHHVEHVIVMENGKYALACDDIGELIMLETESVRWNKASFNNPMFAGIVPEYLCPIINIDNVQQQVAAMPFVQSLNKNY